MANSDVPNSPVNDHLAAVPGVRAPDDNSDASASGWSSAMPELPTEFTRSPNSTFAANHYYELPGMHTGLSGQPVNPRYPDEQ
jgi:hypothetical protein